MSLKRTLRTLAMGSWWWLIAHAALAGTYYVSSESGSDSNNGLTPGTAFASVAHVNSLALQPGDEVRFFCGEVWRSDPLIVTRSGSAGQPIRFSSYPDGCSDKPSLSGAQPISGWTFQGADVWFADLSSGGNAGLFPNGLNQLFLGQERLPFARWPNIAGHPDGGYAEVDSQPSSNRLTDLQLPPGDWSGAMVHIKGIRWYMLNREVSSVSGTTLTVTADVQCYGGCAQWGYFLSNHPLALDRDGEWYYDSNSNRVYLYSTTGAPANGVIEGSAVLSGAGSYLGGVILGEHLGQHISFVTVENLRVERWFDSGVTTPLNLEKDENHDLTLRGLDISQVDGTGLRLATWVWNAAANGSGPNGWRGGRNLVIEDNTIVGANHFGLDFYGRDSQIRRNHISDIGLIVNLGRSGMGCGTSGTNCTENGDGIRLKHDPGSPDHTARDNTLSDNWLERIGMNGIDVFGRSMTIENNSIVEACSSKGDCGGVRTFGRNNLATTPVSDLVLRNNFVLDAIGNTDGNHPSFDPRFSFGLYIDNFSRDVTVSNNTISGSTWAGVLYQHSTGSVTGNTVYRNSEFQWGMELSLVGDDTSVELFDNVFFARQADQRTLQMPNAGVVSASDRNFFFQPYRFNTIAVTGQSSVAMTLAEWRSLSGLDANSTATWYSLGPSEPDRSWLLLNQGPSNTLQSLGGLPLTGLDQSALGTELSLPAHSSLVVVVAPNVLFVDGFDSGRTARWD